MRLKYLSNGWILIGNVNIAIESEKDYVVKFSLIIT